MTDEEFERFRLEHVAAWAFVRKDPIRHPVMAQSSEKQQAILETALERISVDREGCPFYIAQLAGVLLDAGVPASDATICKWMEAQSTFRYPFSSLPTGEFVRWVELQVERGGLSIPLLTCLRKHLPLITRQASDKKHRELMRRLSVALKLIEDVAIPEIRDAWTAKALNWRESLPPEDRVKWDELLSLANTQRSKRPGKSFLQQARATSAALPQFSMIMRDIMESIGRDGPVGVRFRGYPSPMKNLLDEDFTDLLRALIWLCAPYPDLTSHLRDAGIRCNTKIPGVGPLSAKLAATCAEVLGEMEIATAAEALSCLQNSVRHKSTRKGLAKAISGVEKRSGIEWTVLEETHVPDFGFSIPDNPALKIGDWIAALRFTHRGVPELIWSDGITPPISKLPPGLQGHHAGEVAAIKSLVREVKRTSATVMQRLERMMCQTRRISAATWQRHYLDHPIVGPLSRRLLWNVDGTLVGFPPLEDGSSAVSPVTIEGDSVAVGDNETVCLWHRAELSERERCTWEKWVLDHRLPQPFQQALREVFLPEGDRVEDTRFAGELLHQGAFAALCRERGWNYSFHGEPTQFEPFVRMEGSGIRGVMRVSEEPDSAGEPQLWLRILDVRFFPEFGDAPIPFGSVPPVVFSEVMRDVGLFVAVTTKMRNLG